MVRRDGALGHGSIEVTQEPTAHEKNESHTSGSETQESEGAGSLESSQVPGLARAMR
jgi:hypothetical protein